MLMFQGTFALFNRALCSDFRLIRTHLFRLLFAITILLCLVSARSTSQFMGAAGLKLFTQIIYLNFAFIVMAGINFFATAITEEKEEQTLELLVITGVNPIALMLGKSIPRLISALLLLSIQFPFTLLAITLGGVTLSQVIAAYVALAAFLFCLSNLGLICSVVSGRSLEAASLVVLYLVIYFLAQPVLNLLLNTLIYYQWIADQTMFVDYAKRAIDWIGHTSVLSQIDLILTSGFNESLWGIQFWSNLVFGIILFFFACLLFNRFALIEVSAIPDREVLSTEKISLLSPGRTWENALMWKDFNFLSGGYGMTFGKFIAYGIILLLVCLPISSASRKDIAVVIFFVMLFITLIEVTIISSQVFRIEIQENTLPSISMLPTPISKIAYSKIAGALLSLIPACVYLLLGFLLAIEDIVRALQNVLPEPVFWMILVEVLLFWHLSAYFSTYAKWWALPLTCVLMYVGNIVLFIFVAIITAMGFGVSLLAAKVLFVFFTLAMCVGIVISHFLIKERLILLASR